MGADYFADKNGDFKATGDFTINGSAGTISIEIHGLDPSESIYKESFDLDCFEVIKGAER